MNNITRIVIATLVTTGATTSVVAYSSHKAGADIVKYQMDALKTPGVRIEKDHKI